jgi:hypothetical protein
VYGDFWLSWICCEATADVTARFVPKGQIVLADFRVKKRESHPEVPLEKLEKSSDTAGSL